MRESGALRVVIASPLDHDKTWNNRDHNMVRCFSRSGCEVVILYKAMNRREGFLNLLKDTATFSIRERREGNVRFVRIDPFFNYYAGYRAQAELAAGDSGKTFSLRRMLIRFLSPLSILRDVFFVPCFAVAALAKLKGRADVCIGFGPWGALAGWIIRGFGKAGILLYEDRDYEPGLMPDKVRRTYTDRLDRFLLKRADMIVSVGHYLAELRERQSGKDVHVIPNGVEWDRFAEAREAQKPGMTLVYTGNLISWSGLGLAIRAFPDIVKECPSARLLIAGDGLAGYKEQLRNLVRELRLEEHVTFLGSIPNAKLPSILGQADVGLALSEPVPYRKYAYPLKVIEYMAAGLPTIGTADTETADILARYECGIPIPYETGALAETVVTLFRNREVRERLSRNAIRHSEGMKWETLMSRELELIALRAGGKR